MRTDVTDDLVALAAFLATQPADPVSSAYRDGALWVLSRVSGHDVPALAMQLGRLMTAPALPPPDPQPAPVVREFTRAEMIAMAGGGSPTGETVDPPEMFGPPNLGLRVTGHPASRNFPARPTPSFSAAADAAAADGNPAAEPPTPEELEAIRAERAAAIEADSTP